MKQIGFILICVLALVLSGCNNEEIRGQINDNVVCKQWGCSQGEVELHMANFKQQTAENGFVSYFGFGNFKRISYQFEEGLLQASMIIVPEEETSPEAIDDLFRNYVCLGEMNGATIYINEKENTFSTVVKKIKNGESYYSIGYTKLAESQEQ